MAQSRYDAIVVGARCAGSPAAMLLAREGHKVLLVDRATFPSDTISTHLIHPPGVAALARWGLLDRLVATGCPPVRQYSFDFGPFAIVGAPGASDSPVSYGPRRTVLDKLLLDAAAAAGATVREGFTVEELIVEDGRVAGIRGRGNGGSVTERAHFVVGADGHNSFVARAVGATAYHEKPRLQAGYYSYWSGLSTSGRLEAYDVGGRGIAAWPTNDGMTLVIADWPMAEFETNRSDIEAQYMATIARAPGLHQRMRAARREERFVGAAIPNYFRKPWGPGWALAGDAGYLRDFITAQGISDAFRSAEQVAGALHETFAGGTTFDTAMAEYQAARDRRALPVYEFTCEFAELKPPSDRMKQLLAAMLGNQEAMDGWARMFAGVTSPAEFFSDENIGRIFAAASAR